MVAQEESKLRVYNTLTARIEEFRPIKGRRVRMFVCGPTVYDYSHLGHARTYVAFDIVARFLRKLGYSVFYLMNITDIDDKIIKKAQESGTTAQEIADKYTEAFFEDMKTLNITSVNLYAKATDHIDEIIDQVSVLIDKGYAYEANGSVYYEVRKFKDFGKLSGQSLENLIAGARVEVVEEKKNPEDFALWKAKKEGEPFWQSPWGLGRPGWHVEDTAITMTYFGAQYDIHGGARDLIFPHHEAEIAIAEAITGVKPFVKYWMHTGFLNIEGEKMSKSLGNIIRIRDIVKKYDPMAVRFYLAYTHYRKPIDFTTETMDDVVRAYNRIMGAYRLLCEQSEGNKNELAERADNVMHDFMKEMMYDFNTRNAIASIFRLVDDVYKYGEDSTPQAKAKARRVMEEFFDIIGISPIIATHAEIFENIMDILLSIREEARKRRDWETADKIRSELKKIGIIVEDTANGPRWKIGASMRSIAN
ncbi:MAG: cysteine--tRNA ligase [Thermoplasmata archaeon]|nr:MAG: cysteine--tRNA ligase [Thermoplasmata archaeon]